MNTMNKLFFDIETAPAPENKHAIVESIYQGKLDKYDGNYPTKYEDFLATTSFSGGLGVLVCIGYAVNDQETKVLVGDEKKQLLDFWKLVAESDLLIGHNILDFDLPFLKKKSITLGVKPAPISLRRYASSPVFDTLHEWNCWNRSDGFGSLDALAKTLNLESSKKDINGSKVAQYFAEGRIDEITDYCQADVDLTRRIYGKITFEKSESDKLF